MNSHLMRTIPNGDAFYFFAKHLFTQNAGGATKELGILMNAFGQDVAGLLKGMTFFIQNHNISHQRMILITLQNLVEGIESLGINFLFWGGAV